MAELHLFTLLTWHCNGCGLWVQGEREQVIAAVEDHVASATDGHWSKAARDAGQRVVAGRFGYTTWITGPFSERDGYPPLIRV